MLTFEDGRHRDMELSLGPYPYRGRSVGSYATCHQFPGFGLMFDVGLAGLSSIPIGDVFVTHGHDDHVGGLGAHHLRRDGWGLPPARYYVQADDLRLASRVFDQSFAARQHRRHQYVFGSCDRDPVEMDRRDRKSVV